MDTTRQIKDKLQQALSPDYMEIFDESASHAGHMPAAGGGGTHFRVRIVSSLFAGRSRVERHRMVNEALKDEFQGRMHALAIEAWAPGERR